MKKKKKIIKEKKKSWGQIQLCRILGLFFLIMPLLMYISLLSYNKADPSFNKVTDSEVKNLLGTFGSYSADFILSTFGLAFIIFLLVPLFWSAGLLKYQAFAEYKSRILAWFVGLLSLACFIDSTCHTYLGKFNLPYNLTGEWSRSLSRNLSSFTNIMTIPYNTILFEGIILFIAVLSFNFSAGITFKLWMGICQRIYAFFAAAAKLIWSLMKKAAKVREYKEFKELNPSYLQSKMQFGSAGKLKIKRSEAEFQRITPTFSDTPPTLPSASSIAESVQTSLQSGPQIEIPQASPQAHAKTFNPTFDFVSEGDIANQNVKKPTHKITPEEIYQTEGVKSFAAKKTAKSKADNDQQQDLLAVPAAAENQLSTAPQAQMSTTETLDRTPTPLENKPVAPSAEPKHDAPYRLPDIELLSRHENHAVVYDEEMLKANAAKLEEVLKDFGIHGKIVKVRPGPVVTLYELEPAPGTRTARVIGLSDDIARSMSAMSVRMAVVSGHNTIGIELPNEKRETVWLRQLLEDAEFTNSKNILNVALGKDIGGQPVYADLSKMPHLLVAGTTGSGKSVGVNSMILSLIFRMTPDQCKFIMIDPKQLEFSMYNGIPHLLTPVITDPAKAVVGLKWAVREMEDRYRSMALLNVRNIAGYNQKVKDMQQSGKEIKKTIQTGFDKETGRPIYEEQVINTEPMPYIVIVVDEMADLMLVAGKEVEAAIQRLAQMARAAGIHLIMSTQRPSVDVITGTIKANFPSRISFHVTTKIDSRTILGEQGAEQLLGMGDMLYMPSGLRPIRVHGCFVPDNEVEAVVEYVKDQGEPQYVASVTDGDLNGKDGGSVFDKGDISASGSAGGDDELYRQAVEIVRADKKASTSYIQRKLRLGYNRAAILIERMEDEGVVTPPDRVGRRQVVGFED